MPRKPRIVIPENPADLFALDELIYAQHQKLGAKSPLNALEELPSWDEVGPKVAVAQTLQAQIDQLEKDLKNLYGQRQLLLDVFVPQTRSSRDLLTGVYSQNLRRLGEFGFEVIEEAEKKAVVPPAK
ncbi:hypothetical protein SAMN02745146_0504 [Hymenobacter daecheongensis DSM 21074]|uniref:Uncharacterized protein n=1 Tax=Hymenobacter daecheongensis DSM 21074 TaxID=1121955 RepID=A0A1M6A5D8_9BACT|nr:hypothetical protein [Hymenobacter daecheongensis]SHI31660.1 hypothetical protein SAMN02745146_0504 [Hymenobacter daecheongensis DSM 21074]